ncbi:hypothetical protein AAG570_005061 [Ranatra chinensis]|uniref:SWIM-type domain-containing protein n=1 Tax=Ranatra chinensis TaxID=642074 RepID=A0ABD0XZC5_9HEMI
MRPWRKLCPPAVRKSQQSALQTSSLFLVREAGPAAFIIEEESMREVTRVTLGDTHTCTCKQFKASKELCIHICWVLLKKLRLRTVDPLSFQVGLDQRELDNCLRGVHEWRPGVVGAGASIAETRGPGQPKPVRKRLVGDNDICPICLEEFSARRSPRSRAWGEAIGGTSRPVLVHDSTGVAPQASHGANVPSIREEGLRDRK